MSMSAVNSVGPGPANKPLKKEIGKTNNLEEYLAAQVLWGHWGILSDTKQDFFTIVFVQYLEIRQFIEILEVFKNKYAFWEVLEVF